MRHSHADSAEARSPNYQARRRTLPSADANAVRPDALPSTVSSRNGHVDDQTPPRSPRPRSLVPLPMPRPPLDGPDAQRHDSVMHRGFLQSPPVPFVPPGAKQKGLRQIACRRPFLSTCSIARLMKMVVGVVIGEV